MDQLFTETTGIARERTDRGATKHVFPAVAVQILLGPAHYVSPAELAHIPDAVPGTDSSQWNRHHLRYGPIYHYMRLLSRSNGHRHHRRIDPSSFRLLHRPEAFLRRDAPRRD